MALMVELSGEVPVLARREALDVASLLAGLEAQVRREDGPVLLIGAGGLKGAQLAERLGLAHHVCDAAVSGDPDSAVDLAASVDIGEAPSFRVRVRTTETSALRARPSELEAQVGALIQERTGARVDLTDPVAEVRLVLGASAHAGLLGGSVDRKGMEARAVKHRPFSHPISLHPKYARAMVNLAMVPLGGRILDPFCGTGGVLIEAALLGYEPLGSDIDPRMVEGSKRNLEAMGLKAGVEVADVSDAGGILGGPPDAIVTDPPYGRSTSLHGSDELGVLKGLYSMAEGHLPHGHALVVCLPSTSMLPPEEAGFRLSSVHPMKVHRSLTRHVCVLIRDF